MQAYRHPTCGNRANDDLRSVRQRTDEVVNDEHS